MAYITEAELEAYMGAGDSGVDLDSSLVTDLIARGTAMIERWTGRDFEADSDTTRYIDAVGDHVQGDTLYIDHIGDLCAITTVTNGNGVAVASSEYTTLPRNHTPYYALKILGSASKSWTYSTDMENAISIEGRWGYSTSPPDDIKQACIQLVRYLYLKATSPIDVEQTSVSPSGVMMMPATIPNDIQAMLKPYRKMVR